MNNKILFVNNEERIYKLLKMYICAEGYKFDTADNIKIALNMISSDNYLLVILNLGEENYLLCRKIREQSFVPLVMLHDHRDELSIINAFEAGVDDYIYKPFSPRELMYRIRAIMRRASKNYDSTKDKPIPDKLFFHGLVLDRSAYQVGFEDRRVQLTQKEYELLYNMLQKPGKVFSRQDLLRDIWGYAECDSRIIDAHIKRLREKLRVLSPQITAMIITIWRAGYKFEYTTIN